MLKLLIGLGTPYVGVLALLPWVATVDKPLFGIPFIYAWVFIWFVLTSACLLACWLFFDRHSHDTTGDTSDASETRT